MSDRSQKTDAEVARGITAPHARLNGSVIDAATVATFFPDAVSSLKIGQSWSDGKNTLVPVVVS